MEQEKPTVVCLCGSTRFWREFQREGLAETMEGRIVLSIGAATGTDDEHFGNLPKEEYDRIKGMLDTLHLRKIDLADEILVLNVDGYVGESTAREVAYARRHGKRIRWLEAGIDNDSSRRLRAARNNGTNRLMRTFAPCVPSGMRCGHRSNVSPSPIQRTSLTTEG